MKAIRTAYVQGKDWREECHNFLMAYLTAPDCATKIHPADLIFNQKIRRAIPNGEDEGNVKSNEVTCLRNYKKSKEKSKSYTHAKTIAILRLVTEYS